MTQNTGSTTRHLIVKTRFWLWSLRNWLKGYQFRPVQRFRCCEHTTPLHYGDCPKVGFE